MSMWLLVHRDESRVGMGKKVEKMSDTNFSFAFNSWPGCSLLLKDLGRCMVYMGVLPHSPFSLSAVLIVIVCIVAVLAREALAEGTLWAVFVMTGSVLLCMLVTGIIWRQPESKTKLSFKVSRPVGDVRMGHRHFLPESWALVTGHSWEFKLGDPRSTKCLAKSGHVFRNRSPSVSRSSVSGAHTSSPRASY